PRPYRAASGGNERSTTTRTRPDAPGVSGITPARTRGTVRSPNVRCTGTSCAAAGKAPTSAAQQARSGIARRKSIDLSLGSLAMAGAFAGKRALVLGVANKRSIAWAIAQELAGGGAQLAFTYQGERIEKSVRDLAAGVDTALVTECDVRADEDVARVFAEVGDAFGGELDILVHSVAFAAAEDLEGRFTDTPRDRFWMAVDVSAYSLVVCARAAEPL